MINWNVSKGDSAIIRDIVERALRFALRNSIRADQMSLSMDITATHANGCRLRLRDLLEADDATFGHDVLGIMRFIDRETGKLGGCFVPRTAAREAVQA